MANSDALDLAQAPDEGKFRLEFTGDNVGSIWFTHPVSGVEYRGGNNSVDKYQDVPASDAPYLVSLGVFKRLVFNPDGTLALSKAEQKRIEAERKEAEEAAAAQAKAEADALAQAQLDLANQQADFEAEAASDAAAQVQAELDAQAEREAQAKADAAKEKKASSK